MTARLPGPGPGPGPALRLAALWVGLVAGGVLAGLAVEGNGFDGALVRSVAAERSAAVTSAARLVTDFGGVWLDVIFAVAVAGLFLAGRRRQAGFVLLAGGGAMLVTNAVKFLLARPRPAGGGLVSVSSYSWPSGHAASSIALYGGLAAVALRRAPPSPAGRATWVALGALLLLIGASRVYLGVHYATDVLGGWAVGGLWLLGLLRIFGRPALSADPPAA